MSTPKTKPKAVRPRTVAQELAAFKRYCRDNLSPESVEAMVEKLAISNNRDRTGHDGRWSRVYEPLKEMMRRKCRHDLAAIGIKATKGGK